ISDSIVHRIETAGDQLEMIVNTSRTLTLEQKIPQAQANNPEIVELLPLSPTQIQVFAKKPGVTQINLWTQDEKIHTVDVSVIGDAQELNRALQTSYPDAELRVIPLSNSVIVSGHVNDPRHINGIIEIAQDYYPRVINQI